MLELVISLKKYTEKQASIFPNSCCLVGRRWQGLLRKKSGIRPGAVEQVGTDHPREAINGPSIDTIGATKAKNGTFQELMDCGYFERKT